MIQLISLGLLAGLFFSATFVLNRWMSLAGGHWVWSAALRYAYMILFLMGWQSLSRGVRGPARIFRIFFRHWAFWTLSGSIGFGGFYALLCFSADHAAGWVVATTWQLTIIASLVVLVGFGRTFPRKVWGFSFIVFLGVVLVNTAQAGVSDIPNALAGAVPVLVAAFCYPTGNQLVWEAQKGHRFLPCIDDPLVENPFVKVLLLSLGSMPFWLVLVAANAPPPPSAGQLVHTALVALFSGICATGLFLFARSKSKTGSELAAVDATQSSEVIFAMIGEIVLVGAPLPGGAAAAGILLVFAGLGLFIRFQEAPA